MMSASYDALKLYIIQNFKFFYILFFSFLNSILFSCEKRKNLIEKHNIRKNM